jgi:hypothetical protein
MCAGRRAGGLAGRRAGGLAGMVGGGAAWLPCVAQCGLRSGGRWEGFFEVPWKGNKKVPADEGPFPDSSEAVLSLQTTVDSKVIDAKYTINDIIADTLTQESNF